MPNRIRENWDLYQIRAASPALRIEKDERTEMKAGINHRGNLYPYLIKQKEQLKQKEQQNKIQNEQPKREEMKMADELENPSIVTNDSSVTEQVQTTPPVSEMQEVEDDILTDDDDLLVEDDSNDPEVSEAVDNTSKGGITYGVIGAGQGGGRIAFEGFYLKGIHKCICVNSAKQDLGALTCNGVVFPENQKVYCLVDKDGAGKDVKKGEEAINKYSQDIINKMKTIFGKVDNIIICVGGSGGTGTGAMMVLNKLAVQYLDMIGVSNPQNKVGFFVTLPKRGEFSGNPIVRDNTKVVFDNIKELISKKASPIIIADNDKIDAKFGKKLTPANYWPKINASLAGTFVKINELTLVNSSLTPFDPTDYSKVISESGCFVIGTSDIAMDKFNSSSTAVSEVLSEKIKSSLLADFDITQAKIAGLIAILGNDAMNTIGVVEKIEAGFNTFKAAIGNNISIFPSMYPDARQKGIRVYAIVGGLGLPIHSILKD